MKKLDLYHSANNELLKLLYNPEPSVTNGLFI